LADRLIRVAFAIKPPKFAPRSTKNEKHTLDIVSSCSKWFVFILLTEF